MTPRLSTSVSLTGLSSYPNAELRFRVMAVCDASGTNSSAYSSAENFLIFPLVRIESYSYYY